jgi:hypothetical protein
MPAVAFDTLKLAQRLEAAGFSVRQAQDTTAALAETLTGAVATAADIHESESRLHVEIADVRTAIADLRAEQIKWAIGIGIAGVVAIGGMILSATLALLRAVGHG